MIEKRQKENPLTQVRESKQIFANLLQGLRKSTGFDYQGLKTKLSVRLLRLNISMVTSPY